MFKEGTPMRLDCITTEITFTFSVKMGFIFIQKKVKNLVSHKNKNKLKWDPLHLLTVLCLHDTAFPI